MNQIPALNIHETFISALIHNPVETYKKLRAEFENKNQTFGQFEELWPVVAKLLEALNNKETLAICQADIGLALQRKLVLQDLRHVSIRNRVIAPYVETVRVIAKALEFFDACVRYTQLKDSNVTLDTFLVEEENPRERSLAYYHRYRYLYWYSWLVDKIPDVFIIPTSHDFTARELIRFRCVPIFVAGVSTKLIYVDEFEQTPIEFFMHDINHARRQYMANLQWYKDHELFSEEQRLALFERAHAFTKPLLDSLEIAEGDGEAVVAMKNLKVMILFEIAHEDADVLLPETVSNSLQRKEGFKSRFEVPHIDAETGLMDVQDTIETGIATLAYVRHKLQRSFYAKAGSNNHAVELKYATTAHIARAAYELLRDIGAKPKLGVPADSAGYIDEAWLLERTCSFGPEMIHESEIVDANLEELGSEIKEVNVKEYFALSKGVQAQTESALTTVAVKRPPMAQIKFTVDGLVFTVHNDKLKVLLTKRKLPPQADLYALPGGFLWEGENGKACAIRILRDKASVEVSDLEQLATFDSPIRDPRGHMVSTVYFALSNYESLADSFERNQKTITANHESQSIDNLLFDVDNLPETAFDHATIIAHGVERLRAKASYSNILKNILPAKFHKSDFIHMVQIVAGKHVAPEVVLNTFLSHEVITWTTDLDKNKLYEFSDPNLTTYDNM